MTPFIWHGGLMLLAWMALLPGGALIARFYKVLPRQDFPAVVDSRAWWRAHLTLQYGGSVVAAAAFWIAYDAAGRVIDWSNPHAALGSAVLAICALQVASGLLRGSKGGPTDKRADPADPSTWRGDHYDMTLRRRAFERWHKHAGYIAFVLALPTAWLGLGLVDAPAAMTAVPLVAAGVFIAAFATLTRRRRRVDTWVAIWGPPAVALPESAVGIIRRERRPGRGSRPADGWPPPP